MTRREFNQQLLLTCGGLASSCALPRQGTRGFRIATFEADITPPIGHPLMGGGIEPAREMQTRLTARGFVLISGSPEQSVVFVVLDWCELRNSSYLEWQQRLASAAETTRERVFVTCNHVHDAPIMDADAERILGEFGAAGRVCDSAFNKEALSRTVMAVHEALPKARHLTRIGFGKSVVENVASNRRFIRSNGEISFARTSSTKDPEAHSAPEGTIDPILRMLSFWSGRTVVAILSVYSTHPMSTYGRGLVSWDFVGDAREKMTKLIPSALHIYASGCSGNVTAGKFNDGTAERRGELSSRLFAGMKAAWEDSYQVRPSRAKVCTTTFELSSRREPEFSRKGLGLRLKTDQKPFGQCLAALGLSWLERVEAGVPLSLQAIDFGPIVLLLLPAESYVEYQLYAQAIRPDAFIICVGYGECGPGYIPTEIAWREKDTNLRDWCWVAPGAETILKGAISKILKSPAADCAAPALKDSSA
jgi:hypothetical protein